MQSTSIPFTFQQPGAPKPGTGAKTQMTVKEHTKRCGLMAMRPGSSHVMSIGDKPQVITARDRRAFPFASGKFFCTHALCANKFHDTIEQLQRAHEPQAVLEKRGEVHLFGFYSNDPCNTKPEKGCADCTKASADATRVARAKDKDAVEVGVCCPEHAGGAVGLLTPTDPNVPSS